MARPNWVGAEDEFESWFTSKNQFVFPFEDAREVMGARQSRKVFTKGQPADYLVVDNGFVFFAEVKSTEHETSFALSHIQKSQWNAAARVVAANGNYFFFIRKEPERVWFKVPASFFLDIQAQGVKSVKWAYFESFKHVQNR